MQDGPQLVGDRTECDVALSAREKTMMGNQALEHAGRHVGFDFIAAMQANPVRANGADPA
jgi:hypothetical protein